jgi:hypothetical protein
MIMSVEPGRGLELPASTEPKTHSRTQWRNLVSFALFFCMVSGLFLLDAVLPLGGLKFPDALLTQLGSWPLLPTRILFPHEPITLAVASEPVSGTLSTALAWKHTGMLLGVFAILFLSYLLALRRLPRQISFRYILISTMLLGTMCFLIPVVTSGDVFSYIAYARMGVIYHLNPLTTFPTSIRTDPVYPLLYWIEQPSAYGPTWIIITYLLQLFMIAQGHRDILSMVLALRAFGLAMHLASTWLIYSISGRLQHLDGSLWPEKRLQAVLAFAWNPLLLLEACVNAHNDTTLLCFILLAIWFLIGREQTSRTAYLAAACMLAIATCLKVNVVILAPGLFILLWRQLRTKQRLTALVTSTATYFGVLTLLYAPFWQSGAALNVFRVNPAAYRNINTFAETLSRLYNSLTYAPGFLDAASSVSPAQHDAHMVSITIFVLLYVLLCWLAIRVPHGLSTLRGLFCWMALVWLLYCAIGSPWFWPWYTTTFFGLYALVQAVGTRKSAPSGTARLPLAVHMLSFSMLSLYCFLAWFPAHIFVSPLPGFRWLYLSGLWAWGLPLLVLGLSFKPARVGSFFRENEI